MRSARHFRQIGVELKIAHCIWCLIVAFLLVCPGAQADPRTQADPGAQASRLLMRSLSTDQSKMASHQLASAPTMPNEHLVRAAGRDCRKLHSVLNDLLIQLEQGMNVPVSQPNVVGTEVIPATPSPSGVLNSGYMPLRPKQIAAASDKIRESSLILADELNQVTEPAALAVFDSTKAIRQGQISLNEGWQKLLQSLAEQDFDRKDASNQARDLLQTVEKLESELKKYHPPFQ